MFEKAFPKASVKLRSTVHQNRELVVELTKFLQETSPSGKGPGRVALLVESGTLFGLQSSASTQDGEPSAKAPKEQEPDVFKFPMGISRIRQEYTAKGIYASKEPVRLAAPSGYRSSR